MLEKLVHTSGRIPSHQVCVTFESPDLLAISTIAPDDAPGWDLPVDAEMDAPTEEGTRSDDHCPAAKSLSFGGSDRLDSTSTNAEVGYGALGELES